MRNFTKTIAANKSRAELNAADRALEAKIAMYRRSLDTLRAIGTGGRAARDGEGRARACVVACDARAGADGV